jgi:hypothetical protein
VVLESGNYPVPLHLWRWSRNDSSKYDGASTSPDLQSFEKAFIWEAMTAASNSSELSGLISSVFNVNGTTVVLTAKYNKLDNKLFDFDVVKNDTYEDNIKELSSL